MKHLHTFGRAGSQPSSFSYERKKGGVDISQGGEITHFSHSEWEQIVASVDGLGVSTITGGAPTRKSISETIKNTLPNRQLNDSSLACIAKILENEGTIELYHGAAGQGVGVGIHFNS